MWQHNEYDPLKKIAYQQQVQTFNTKGDIALRHGGVKRAETNALRAYLAAEDTRAPSSKNAGLGEPPAPPAQDVDQADH